MHADEKLSAFVELERQALTVTFYLASIHAECAGRTVVSAHRDGKRFVVRADEKLTAFLKLESWLQQIALTSWRNSRQTGHR